MAARKKPAPKRGASRYRAPAKKPVPGWIWLACGLVVGGFFMFLFSLEPGRDEIKRDKGEQVRSTKPEPKPTQPEPARPKYDFYTLLPQSSNPSAMMQAPNEDQVRSNEAARAQALHPVAASGAVVGFIDLLRVIHAQDHLVGKPVGENVHHAPEKQRHDHSRSTTEIRSDQAEKRHDCGHQQGGFEPVAKHCGGLL